MSAAYRVIKSTWRQIVPPSFNRFVFDGNNPLSRAVLSAKAKLETTAAHDEIYDEAYFRRHLRNKIGGAQIVSSLLARFDIESVVDVGCGAGEIILEFGKVGVSTRGLEYSMAALAICLEQGLEVHPFNLETDTAPDWKVDLVISTEVAEHLPASCADRYVDLMCGMASKVIVMTAATPGQGGTDHINEQPYSYWIEKFAARDWCFLSPETISLREEWLSSGVEGHRSRNVMLFAPK